MYGFILRELRSSHGFKQSEVARAIGLSLRQYNRLENGTSNLTIDVLKRICLFYSISADFILQIDFE